MLKVSGYVSIALFSFVFLSGCDEVAVRESVGRISPDNNCSFGLESVHITGLTEFVRHDEQTVLTVYVDMLDSFEVRIKAPAVLRLEIYEYTPRSSDPRGKRLFLQPDVDITDPAENNRYWQDHMRSYRFELPLNFKPVADSDYIIEVTCIRPDSRRLTDKFQLTCD